MISSQHQQHSDLDCSSKWEHSVVPRNSRPQPHHQSAEIGVNSDRGIAQLSISASYLKEMPSRAAIRCRTIATQTADYSTLPHKSLAE
jgi:hypothetical protein